MFMFTCLWEKDDDLDGHRNYLLIQCFFYWLWNLKTKVKADSDYNINILSNGVILLKKKTLLGICSFRYSSIFIFCTAPHISSNIVRNID